MKSLNLLTILLAITSHGINCADIAKLPVEITVNIVNQGNFETICLEGFRTVDKKFHDIVTPILVERVRTRKGVQTKLDKKIKHSLNDFFSPEFSFPCNGLATKNSLFACLYKNQLPI